MSPAHPTNQDLLQVMSGQTQVLILGTENGPQLIISPELSARVLGASFTGTAGENLFWTNPDMYSGSYFTNRPYFWNAGGARTWLAPEDLFFIDSEGEWFVPTQLDPAPFRMIDQSVAGATFEADVNLKSSIDAYYELTIQRRMSLVSEMPVEVRDMGAGIDYLGIDLTHQVTNRSEMTIGVDMPHICLWNLLQMHPSGTTLVPLVESADPVSAYREYFNPLGERLTISNNIISVRIDGAYRAKIGVRAEAAGRGIAYLREDGDGTGILYVLLFPVDPDGIYVDKPWGTESDYGDVIELYNDDGEMGGFTEIECHGPARILGRGETQSHSAMLHIFGGEIDLMKRIGAELLDADLTAAHYY